MTQADNLVSEKALLTYVHDLAKVYGWKMYHQVDTGPCPKCHTPNWSKRIGPGFPDCVLAHENGRQIFAELKSQQGTLREGQAEWLMLLNISRGREVYLWRPSDMDAIAQILQPSYEGDMEGTLVLPGFDLYQPPGRKPQAR